MSRNMVTYPKKTRDRAVAEDRPLFTIDIDRRHCTNLPDNERGRVTLQGPANHQHHLTVSRAFLLVAGVDEDKVDEIMKGRFQAQAPHEPIGAAGTMLPPSPEMVEEREGKP